MLIYSGVHALHNLNQKWPIIGLQLLALLLLRHALSVANADGNGDGDGGADDDAFTFFSVSRCDIHTHTHNLLHDLCYLNFLDDGDYDLEMC